MRRIDIQNGVSITEISLGASGRGDLMKDQAQFEIMDAYLDLGGNCFDTARMYAAGKCDESLGEYFKQRGNRNRVVLCTKGNHPKDPRAMHISRLSPQEIRLDLTESLKAIQTDHSDLHLLHRDDPWIPVSEIMPALDALVREGLTRVVGVSNWTVARIQMANEFAEKNGLHKIALCQMHFSLLQTTAHATRDVTHVPMSDVEFQWYKDTNLPVMAFGNQGRGYFKRKHEGAELKEEHLRYYDHFPENHRRVERLYALACDIGHSPASVAVAYVRDHALNTSALCAFSSMAQLHDSFEATSFTLTQQQIRFLETVER